MAYKPYKVNKGQDNKYLEPKYQIERMKLFGFRSGIAWKMIPALFYYGIIGLILFSSMNGELREFKFEVVDYILFSLKYIFLIVLCYSPAIFLSDFKYNKRLPFFKKESIISKTIGMLFVVLICVPMIWVYMYCMSDTYKKSTKDYYDRIEKQRQEQMNSNSETTEVEQTEIETTVNE
jgi:hypothetical protein